MSGKARSDEKGTAPLIRRSAPVVVPSGKKHPSGNPVTRWIRDSLPTPQPAPKPAPGPPAPPARRQPEARAAEPIQRATLQMLPGRLQPLDGRVLQQEIRFIRLLSKTQSFTLGWNIGEPPAHITMNHSSVRPMHARMTFRDGGWWIECLAFHDPLMINESALTLSDPPRALTDGDRIRIGLVGFRFCFP